MKDLILAILPWAAIAVAFVVMIIRAVLMGKKGRKATENCAAYGMLFGVVLGQLLALLIDYSACGTIGLLMGYSIGSFIDKPHRKGNKDETDNESEKDEQ